MPKRTPTPGSEQRSETAPARQLEPAPAATLGKRDVAGSAGCVLLSQRPYPIGAAAGDVVNFVDLREIAGSVLGDLPTPNIRGGSLCTFGARTARAGG